MKKKSNTGGLRTLWSAKEREKTETKATGDKSI